MTRIEPRNRVFRRAARSLLVVCLLFGGIGIVAAQGTARGDAAMQEGTRLARQDLNRAALRNYEAALGAGMDEPLLHYNIGVAQYRTGNYAAAEAAFREASADQRLAGLALYNLGLAQRAAGKTSAAQRSFAAAADVSADRDLRELGERASAETVRAVPQERAPRAPLRRDEPVGELNVSLVAGYGFDDNIYRAPPAPYIDLSKPDAPEITPFIEESGFVPIDLTAQYRLHSRETDFLFTYDFDGRYYESEFANADDISQELSVAADIAAEGRNGRSRTLRPTLFFFEHWRSNYDPDDGLDREIDEENLEHRVAYRGGGIRFDYEHRIGAFTWNTEAQVERRFHKSVPIVESYDQQVALLRTVLHYDFGSVMRVKAGLRRYRRTFDQRLARDLSGAISDASPTLDYDYDGVEVGFDRWFTRAFLLQIEGLYLRRSDLFEGYDDYALTGVEVAGTFRAGSRFELTLAAISRTYEYPNAFAFDVPSGGPKETEHLGGEMLVAYRINERLALRAQLELFQVTSSDLRAEHERTRSGLGLRWQF